MASANLLKFPHNPNSKGRIARFFDYFATNKGKDLTFKILSGCGLAISCSLFLPQTVFIDYYIDFVRAYE